MAELSMPPTGKSCDEILEELNRYHAGDADWRSSKTWGLVYHAGEDVSELCEKAYTAYFSENAINPLAFPSLKKFENEVIAMTADMLHGGPDAVGNITSGGTESILLAVKAARERARAFGKSKSDMEMLLPISAHPAFMKAADYFDLKPVHIPLRDDFRADVDAAKKLVNDKTALMIGSAPNFPYGVVDPITELAAIAKERDIPFHVDACVGGFILPFLDELGYDIPDFDFRAPGVTSISADLHKYGYAAKGTSAIIYRNNELRKNQFYVWADWPGGVYASPTMTGSKGGGPVAAAWAVMNYLGREGYLRMARSTMKTAKALRDGINAIPGLRVVGVPDATLFAFGSDSINVFMLGDAMGERGWLLDKISKPPALHMVVTAPHEKIFRLFLKDLAKETNRIAKMGAARPEGISAIYGMIGAMPDRKAARDFVLALLGDIYTNK